MKKIASTLVFIFLVCSTIHAQNHSFVYERDGKFFLECEEFYPVMLNYSLTFEDSAGYYRITPIMDQCEQINGCNSCGTSQEEYRQVVRRQLETIAEMGFNSIRLVGLAVKYQGADDQGGHFTGTLVTNGYYTFGTRERNLDCHKFTKEGKPLVGAEAFRKQTDLYAQVFDIIRTYNIPLKVLILAGGHGVEVRSKEFSSYLAYLSARFASESILLGYDLYNEPEYFQEAKGKEYDKYDRAKWVSEWVQAIKDQAPWHLVTYGPVISDVFGWDPEVLPVDFIAPHVYSHPREYFDWNTDTAFITYRSMLRYFSENFSRHWILGETGMPGVDRALYTGRTIHPIVSDPETQRNFAEQSLNYARWYGAGGYAWWNFKDGIWSKKDLDKEIAKQFFFGLENYRDNHSWKPAAFEFQKFDPEKPCTNCIPLTREQYFNPFLYQYPLAEGYIFNNSSSGSGGRPLKGAIISAIVGKPGTKDQNHTCLTFSDENGKFEIYSQYPAHTMIVKYMRISAPGMTVAYHEDWREGLKFSAPYFIQPLRKEKLPQPFSPALERKIAKKEVVWDQKRVLMESRLVLTKGAVLTINDTLYMQPGSKIEVREGAVLKLNGAIIGLCKWEGIDVIEGKTNGKKRREIGGDVRLGKGSVIENSRYNIRRINPNAQELDRN